MPSVDAYIAVETALARVVKREWQKVCEAYTEDILRSFNAGDLIAVDQKINALDTSIIVPKIQSDIEKYGLAAFLYGVANAVNTSNANSSKVVQRKYKPDDLENANAQFELMIGLLTESMIEQTHIEINRQLERLNEEQQTVTKAPAVKNFDAYFGPSIATAGYQQIDIGSSLHLSRLGSYGFFVESDLRGVVNYRISAFRDVRTSEVCRALDGRILPVNEGYNKIKGVINLDDPMKIASLSPWPKSDRASVANLKRMTTEELIAAGYMFPPFHPRCRTILRRTKSRPIYHGPNARPNKVRQIGPEQNAGLDTSIPNVVETGVGIAGAVVIEEAVDQSTD